jgi:type IV secretion system protein TrbG
MRYRMRGLITIIGAGMAGCAAQPPAPPMPAPAVRSEAAAPAPRRVAQLPSGAQILAAQPSEVRQAYAEHQSSGTWPVFRADGSLLVPYGYAHKAVIACAPLHTTDITLEAGETVTDVALGDSDRWQATPASAGDERNPTPHIAIKPQQAGIATNATIYTTERVYHLRLRSGGTALEEFSFYYPDDLLLRMHEADIEAAAAKAHPAQAVQAPTALSAIENLDPSKLNFNYEIKGADVPWRPVRAFDDGTHVYIEVPPQMKAAQAPALLLKTGGGEQLVNYRVAGDYYVVDRLFGKAMLVAGAGGSQDRVTIAYNGAGR